MLDSDSYLLSIVQGRGLFYTSYSQIEVLRSRGHIYMLLHNAQHYGDGSEGSFR